MTEKQKPSFNYDLDIFKLCQKYIKAKNHHGLAVIARQKGLPPFLRYKIWPILLKYHPYVINPSIQPDHQTSKPSSSSPSNIATSNSEVSDGDANDVESNDTVIDETEEISNKIDKDLKKYLTRLKYSHKLKDLNHTEHEIFTILKDSILKFTLKWGKIVKYDSSLTWIALGLAEWFPPIPNTHWVLVGRDIPTKHNNPQSALANNNNTPASSASSASSVYSTKSRDTNETDIIEPTIIKDLFNDYSNYIENLNLNLSDEDSSDTTSVDNIFQPDDKLIDDINQPTMKFYEVLERLVLVLLHCPQNKLKNFKKLEYLNNEKFLSLPKNGGSIEERVTFFIYLFRKLLPELSTYFNEEQILNKFGSNDDEWLIWWLKYCGAKVLSRLDRGRIWDVLLGFKFKSKGKNYNNSLLHLDTHMLSKLGNDNFWTLETGQLSHSNSFNDLNSSNSLINLSNLNFDDNHDDIPFPKINPHIQLIFTSLALLKSREHVLIELDQHEIRQYLSRLPTTSYTVSNKYHIFKQKIDKKREEQRNRERESNSAHGITGNNNTNNNISNFPSSSASATKNSRSSTISDLSDYKSLPNSPISHTSTSTSLSISTSPTDQIISNDSLDNHSIDLMDNIINESSELWRKWLYLESESNNIG